jgi:hypothetical protein
VAGVIDAIEGIAALLAGESLTAREAAYRLGSSVETPGHGLPLRVTPKDERFSAVQVALHTESDAVSHVELELREADRPAVADLAAAFGQYMAPPRVHADSPNRLVFRHAVKGTVSNITLIAVVAPCPGDLVDCPVTTVTLRCDAVD